ncbi:hypothetical protein [Bifidobacterium platyrrhinorum]|uniref:Uncharacterized protein n=1 Tax=Bifidobacterium platyrrhinorum TaxID=2661628 RepID=A0A6L9STK5_9BIFI|nr:hypothetical protein [Bifidobacterium platyrrhinorum]NEG55419.1 hypothetical protein [Bifidobacterium platyrrhinorum]
MKYERRCLYWNLFWIVWSATFMGKAIGEHHWVFAVLQGCCCCLLAVIAVLWIRRLSPVTYLIRIDNTRNRLFVSAEDPK